MRLLYSVGVEDGRGVWADGIDGEDGRSEMGCGGRGEWNGELGTGDRQDGSWDGMRVCEDVESGKCLLRLLLNHGSFELRERIR